MKDEMWSQICDIRNDIEEISEYTQLLEDAVTYRINNGDEPLYNSIFVQNINKKVSDLTTKIDDYMEEAI